MIQYIYIYISQKEADNACFQHDMAYGDFKDWVGRTAAAKLLRNKAFNIAKIHRYDEYQRGSASMVYKFFDKKTAAGAVKNEIMQNKELPDELHKPIIKKLKSESTLIFYRLYLGCWSS